MKPCLTTVLTSQECDAVVDASLRILDECGVRVTYGEAMRLLIDAGAKRGEDGRIRMDGGLVRDLIEKAPHRFRLHHRNGGSVVLGAGARLAFCGGTVASVAD